MRAGGAKAELRRRSIVAAFAASILALASCKSQISPHIAPEADAELLVSESLGTKASIGTAKLPGQERIVLTLNNAPGADQPVEQDIVQREIDMFEKQNPGIRIEFSTWAFTPESFFDRARNRTLTDIVEVSAEQMGPIIDLNYAADITDNFTESPEVRILSPDALQVCIRDRKVYGLPVELHTMALFYNRSIFERVITPPKEEPKTAPKSDKEKKKGKGADGDPREYSDSPVFLMRDRDAGTIPGPQDLMWNSLSSFAVANKAALAPQPILLAQYASGRRDYYGNQQDDEDQNYSRRGEQAVRDYYGQDYSGGRRPIRSPYGSYYDAQPGYGRRPGQQQQQYDQYGRPIPRVTPAPRDGDFTDEEKGPASAQRFRSDTDEVSPDGKPKKKPRGTIDDDILTTSDEAMTSTTAQEVGTTVVQTAGLPHDWDSFIKTAVKLTDHNSGISGYAPVLFSREGGREFAQWAIQNGLSIEAPSGNTATIDINTSGAGEVAQFLKDLHWRYDVTPPLDRCYNDNLMKSFAEGKVAMMMLPATRATFDRLIKLGMSPDDIGVSALPAGPHNRKHLTFGKCLIINSQLDRAQRAAAFKWLTFKISPDVIKMREQFYFRQQEIAGAPRVPLYGPAKQREFETALRPTRQLPVYADYENIVAANLAPEPPYFTDKLYEAISQGVRPIVEQQASRPNEAIALVGADFEAKFLKNAPTKEGFQRYLRLLTGQ